jgi:hypothetical protein
LSLGGLTATISFGVSTIEEGCAGTDGIMGLGYNAKGASNISESVNGKSANFWDALGFTGSQNVFGFFLSPTGNGQVIHWFTEKKFILLFLDYIRRYR